MQCLPNPTSPAGSSRSPLPASLAARRPAALPSQPPHTASRWRGWRGRRRPGWPPRSWQAPWQAPLAARPWPSWQAAASWLQAAPQPAAWRPPVAASSESAPPAAVAAASWAGGLARRHCRPRPPRRSTAPLHQSRQAPVRQAARSGWQPHTAAGARTAPHSSCAVERTLRRAVHKGGQLRQPSVGLGRLILAALLVCRGAGTCGWLGWR